MRKACCQHRECVTHRECQRQENKRPGPMNTAYCFLLKYDSHTNKNSKCDVNLFKQIPQLKSLPAALIQLSQHSDSLLTVGK